MLLINLMPLNPEFFAERFGDEAGSESDRMPARLEAERRHQAGGEERGLHAGLGPAHQRRVGEDHPGRQPGQPASRLAEADARVGGASDQHQTSRRDAQRVAEV